MIALVWGKDRRSVKEATQKEIKKLIPNPKELKNTGFFVYEGRDIDVETLFAHVTSTASLFETGAIVIVKDLSESLHYDYILKNFQQLAKSASSFFFVESAPKKEFIDIVNKYSGSVIEVKSKTLAKDDSNPFEIANLLERKDKYGMWALYLKKLGERENFMSMSGIINWKIRDMVAKGKYGKWTKEELVSFSREMLEIESIKRNKGLSMELEFEKLILSI